MSRGSKPIKTKGFLLLKNKNKTLIFVFYMGLYKFFFIYTTVCMVYEKLVGKNMKKICIQILNEGSI